MKEMYKKSIIYGENILFNRINNNKIVIDGIEIESIKNNNTVEIFYTVEEDNEVYFTLKFDEKYIELIAHRGKDIYGSHTCNPFDMFNNEFNISEIGYIKKIEIGDIKFIKHVD